MPSFDPIIAELVERQIKYNSSSIGSANKLTKVYFPLLILQLVIIKKTELNITATKAVDWEPGTMHTKSQSRKIAVLPGAIRNSIDWGNIWKETSKYYNS